jgi:hypothetical protein
MYSRCVVVYVTFPITRHRMQHAAITPSFRVVFAAHIRHRVSEVWRCMPGEISSDTTTPADALISLFDFAIHHASHALRAPCLVAAVVGCITIVPSRDGSLWTMCAADQSGVQREQITAHTRVVEERCVHGLFMLKTVYGMKHLIRSAEAHLVVEFARLRDARLVYASMTSIDGPMGRLVSALEVGMQAFGHACAVALPPPPDPPSVEI